jgi:predicted HTH domain antitoxin
MEWIIEELQKLSEIKPEAMDKILDDVKNRSPDIFKSLVISAYLDEKISIGKVAEMLGIPRIMLQKEFRNKGIPMRVISADDAIAEVEAMRTWK